MAEPTLSVLLETLVAERRQGCAFEDAWPRAVCAALADESGDELAQWQAALNGTMLAWQASYCRWPQRRVERALVAVADDPERVAVTGTSDCPMCGGPVIRSGRGPAKTYCSRVCQRAAHGRRYLAA